MRDEDQSWWLAVKEAAEFVIQHHDLDASTSAASAVDEYEIETFLSNRGFGGDEVVAAVSWLTRASMSGRLGEILSMLLPQRNLPRMTSPVEKVCLSDKVWGHIERCRHRGILNDALAERLLEGLRVLDSRDWDDKEVRAFIADILSHAGSPVFLDLSPGRLENLLNGRSKTIYS